MARYSKGSQEKVKKVMDEMKEGKLKSGRSGKKVTSRKQAIAIGSVRSQKAGKQGTAKLHEKSGYKKSQLEENH